MSHNTYFRTLGYFEKDDNLCLLNDGNILVMVILTRVGELTVGMNRIQNQILVTLNFGAGLLKIILGGSSSKLSDDLNGSDFITYRLSN